VLAAARGGGSWGSLWCVVQGTGARWRCRGRWRGRGLVGRSRARGSRARGGGGGEAAGQWGRAPSELHGRAPPGRGADAMGRAARSPVEGPGRAVAGGGASVVAGGRGGAVAAVEETIATVEETRARWRRREPRDWREDNEGVLLRSSAPRFVAPSSGPRRRRVSWWTTARQVAQRRDV
jgi:hypothetical protein